MPKNFLTACGVVLCALAGIGSVATAGTSIALSPGSPTYSFDMIDHSSGDSTHVTLVNDSVAAGQLYNGHNDYHERPVKHVKN